jgi:hypothetical protein
MPWLKWALALRTLKRWPMMAEAPWRRGRMMSTGQMGSRCPRPEPCG